jgi:hypothetical protein
MTMPVIAHIDMFLEKFARTGGISVEAMHTAIKKLKRHKGVERGAYTLEHAVSMINGEISNDERMAKLLTAVSINGIRGTKSERADMVALRDFWSSVICAWNLLNESRKKVTSTMHTR